MSRSLLVGKGGYGEGNDGVFCRSALRKMRCVRMRAGRRWGELEDAFIIKIGAVARVGELAVDFRKV